MISLVREVTEHDHMIGDRDAPVTLVEYGDYQCPKCAKAYFIIKRAMTRMDGSLRFVFRNFPLSQSHRMARAAARAAEAAALQGKFWPMHDVLFENQSKLSEDTIRTLAEDLRLDPIRFVADWLERDSVSHRVQEDFMSGVLSGVSTTPGFFINGEKYDGSWEEDDLVRALSAKVRPGEAA